MPGKLGGTEDRIDNVIDMDGPAVVLLSSP